MIVPTNTFFATPAAVRHGGGIPRLADIEAEKLAMHPAKLESLLSARTAGVVLVHIGGWISKHVARVQELCRKRNLFLMEDAAHAHGSTIDGEQAGPSATPPASFYPTKVRRAARAE